MRLNRVLHITAAVGITLAAMIFTISCSDGEDGKNGADCTVAGDEGNYDVICGGANAGKLTNGPQGTSGVDGPKGDAGVDCELVAASATSYQIKCGGVLKGTLEGCNTKSSDDGKEVNVSCAGNPKVALCEGVVFNPSLKYCDASAGIQILNATWICGPSKVKYDGTRRYCGFASEAALTAGTPSILDLCGTSGKPNEAAENGVTKVWELATAPATTWKDEYCKVTRTVAITASTTYGTGNSTDSSLFAITDVSAKATPEYCGGVKVKLNQDTWKGEYCGYADAEAVSKTVVNNACGDAKNPDEEAFGKYYCQMSKQTDSLTTRVNTVCKVGTPTVFTETQMNRVDKNTKLVATDWKGEYCGYASAADYPTASANRVLSVLTGLCGDGNGPNATAWTNDYCQWQKKTDKISKRVTGANNLDIYCINTSTTAWQTAGEDERINENTWKNQYCGYKSKEHYDETPRTVSRLTGVCDDDKGPNQATNVSNWLNQYCQADATGETRVVSTSTTIDTDVWCGINAISPTRNYTGAINKDIWQDQYCGINKDNFDALPDPLTADWVLRAEPLDHPNSATCKPNAVKGTGSYALGVGAKPAWQGQYCQQATKGGNVTVVGTLSNYCGGTAADSLTLDAATVDNRLNEDTWKDQYCGFESSAAFDLGAKKVLSGTCDANGPTGRAVKTPNDASISAFTNEYCQADATGSTTLVVGITGTSPSLSINEDAYCVASTVTVDAIRALTGGSLTAARLNDGSWKGQFCFEDKVRGVCPGGKQPVSNANSDADPRCEWIP